MAEVDHPSPIIDETKTQRIQQLETLLQEYKSTNDQLSSEIDALGGSSSTLGEGKSRHQLSIEIEKERLEKLAVQKGTEEKRISFFIIIRC